VVSCGAPLASRLGPGMVIVRRQGGRLHGLGGDLSSLVRRGYQLSRHTLDRMV
jgi:hypothetical protein